MSSISVVYDNLSNLILLKNRTLRTPEHYNFMSQNKGRIKCVISDNENDIEYVDTLNIPTVVWCNEDKLILPTERDEEKKGTLLYYDKKYIWQFSDYAEKEGLRYPIVSLDERSISIFESCHPRVNVNITPPFNKPDTLIMFAYDEEVINQIDPRYVIIYDNYKVNLASIMSIGDKRVMDIHE
jgi:hypothetical protein